MKFALICYPGQTEWDVQFGSSYHMVLGQHAYFDRAYKEYYEALSRKGHFIMVDNGAAEKEEERIPFGRVLTAAESIHADEIVLPDVLFNSLATIHNAIAWVESVPFRKRVVIPQGNSIDEWLDCLGSLIELARFRTIGIPKHLERFRGGRARALAMAMNKFNIQDRYDIHLFGIWADPRKEILACRHVYDGIRGIDSGAPIAWAQNNETFRGTRAHYSLNPKRHARIEDFNENKHQIIEWCYNDLPSVPIL